MNLHRLRAAAQLSPIRINTAGAQDARGPGFAPASLLLDATRAIPPYPSAAKLLAIGSPAEIDRDPRSAGLPVFDLPETVLLPAFINAHTHLDLTHIGPRPHDPSGGFMPWIEMIRTGRAADDEEIRRSVRRGIELSRSSGVVAVGDIAGASRATPARASLTPWRTMRAESMPGVSFLEFFAIGAGRERFRQWLPALLEEALTGAAAQVPDATRIGLQPHAPNSVCREAYAWAFEYAAAHGLRIATHLAESPEERQFVAAAAGPMRDLLERLGLWDESIPAEVGRGLSPVAHMAPLLTAGAPLVAHVNDASDTDLAMLASTGATVVYCPHASEYFGAPRHFGQHRYRDMLAAGINVALGTDSIVNLPPAAAESPDRGGTGMSILEEMRLLWRRDGTDPRTLLAMGTVNAAAALSLDPGAFELRRGTTLAGIVGVTVNAAAHRTGRGPVQLALESKDSPNLLFDRNYSH